LHLHGTVLGTQVHLVGVEHDAVSLVSGGHGERGLGESVAESAWVADGQLKQGALLAIVDAGEQA